MDYTKSRGSVVELQCISKFIEMGFNCSIPYGDACRYDFIADVNGKLLKIQCKSCVNPIIKGSNGKRDTDAIIFSTSTQTTNTKKTTIHSYTPDEVDYFATYYQGNVYVVPVSECGFAKTLRFYPPNNGQHNYIKAEDYLIEKVFTGNIASEINKSLHTNNKNICSQCGKNEISEHNQICHQCDSLNRRIIQRPNREELKDLIKTHSFVAIGKQYNVSDNAIRKWCLAEGLPIKKKEIKSYTNEEWDEI